MQTNDLAAEANAKVAAYILDAYRSDNGADGAWGSTWVPPHLATCPDAYVTDLDGGDGFYGCDTGCEYMRLTATVRCPHGQSAEYNYGEFGQMYLILDDLRGPGG